MPIRKSISIEMLDAQAFEPYGRVLGGVYPVNDTVTAFTHPGSDFWHVHDFNPGLGGETEVLWVNYRDNSLRLRALEAHWLTEQAIVPLGEGLVHLVCLGEVAHPDVPDLATLRAFRVSLGQGVCMQRGCWHASFVLDAQVTCMMLTRRSTTRELVAHLKSGAQALETSMAAPEGLADLELLRPA